MNRRSLFKAIPALAYGVSVQPQAPHPTALPIARANGTGRLLGVATENVKKGDFVQIQQYGLCRVNLCVE